MCRKEETEKGKEKKGGRVSRRNVLEVQVLSLAFAVYYYIVDKTRSRGQI